MLSAMSYILLSNKLQWMLTGLNLLLRSKWWTIVLSDVCIALYLHWAGLIGSLVDGEQEHGRVDSARTRISEILCAQWDVQGVTFRYLNGGEKSHGENDSNYAVLICIVIPIIPYLILRIPWPSILTKALWLYVPQLWGSSVPASISAITFHSEEWAWVTTFWSAPSFTTFNLVKNPNSIWVEDRKARTTLGVVIASFKWPHKWKMELKRKHNNSSALKSNRPSRTP